MGLLSHTLLALVLGIPTLGCICFTLTQNPGSPSAQQNRATIPFPVRNNRIQPDPLPLPCSCLQKKKRFLGGFFIFCSNERISQRPSPPLSLQQGLNLTSWHPLGSFSCWAQFLEHLFHFESPFPELRGSRKRLQPFLQRQTKGKKTGNKEQLELPKANSLFPQHSIALGRLFPANGGDFSLQLPPKMKTELRAELPSGYNRAGT